MIEIRSVPPGHGKGILFLKSPRSNFAIHSKLKQEKPGQGNGECSLGWVSSRDRRSQRQGTWGRGPGCLLHTGSSGDSSETGINRPEICPWVCGLSFFFSLTPFLCNVFSATQAKSSIYRARTILPQGVVFNLKRRQRVRGRWLSRQCLSVTLMGAPKPTASSWVLHIQKCHLMTESQVDQALGERINW